MGSHTRTQKHGRSPRRSLHDSFFAERGYTQVPMLVQWMATLRCPLSCPHCLAVSQESGFEDMPLGVARSLVRQIAEMGVGEFLVTGGEPLARADLPGVIDALAEHKVNWSLNTACMPTDRLQRAIESYPPAFTAVSLDGPAETHDAFRGRDGAFDDALRSIGYFAGLDGCAVAAGTTVTTSNFDALQETFGIVMQSGASHWGIHLLVQEGRAGTRKDLFLSRRQLSRLLRFVAKNRTYFPVTMADEFGYCGDWEPLVRDLPLTCGAGRTQCVVLPDGEVVPCTTLDRSASAGNINERPLRDIWADGFAELRNCEPKGRCAKCDYATACEGGCWLQRRRGTKCFRDVWHVPEALKTAAGIAVCLGALAGDATGADAVKATPKGAVARRPVRPAPTTKWEQQFISFAGGDIDLLIAMWYGERMGPALGRRPSRYARLMERIKARATAKGNALAADPAVKHIRAFQANELPKDIPGLCKAINNGLATKQQSMAFAALMWRNLSECLLAGPAPEKRTVADRKIVRETLEALRAKAAEWQKARCEVMLKVFVARAYLPFPFGAARTKGLPPPPPPLYTLLGDTLRERWSGLGDPKKKVVAADFLKRHPYAETMTFTLDVPAEAKLSCIGSGGQKPGKGKLAFGVHDLLVVLEGKAGVKATALWSGKPKGKFAVSLPPGTELTYIDIIRLVDAQNAAALDAFVAKAVSNRVAQR